MRRQFARKQEHSRGAPFTTGCRVLADGTWIVTVTARRAADVQDVAVDATRHGAVLAPVDEGDEGSDGGDGLFMGQFTGGLPVFLDAGQSWTGTWDGQFPEPWAITPGEEYPDVAPDACRVANVITAGQPGTTPPSR